MTPEKIRSAMMRGLKVLMASMDKDICPRCGKESCICENDMDKEGKDEEESKIEIKEKEVS